MPGVIKKIGKIVFLRGENVDKNMLRVAAMTLPGLKFGENWSSAVSESRKMVEEIERAAGGKGSIHGTAVGGKIFINRESVKAMKNYSRLVVNHESFHTLPIVGRSEIGAHFYGGLKSEKGKLSFQKAIKEVRELKRIRPDVYKHENRKAIKLSAITAAVGYIVKNHGEGSRGGKIIGHTRSGKPIYASKGIK